MKDWTLNELFQRLLKAESRVLERERCQQEAANNASPREEAKRTTSSMQAVINHRGTKLVLDS